MANLKVVRNRIQSVKSTQQITKAMKMVAASKLRKAQDAILQMRPYVKKLHGIFENASAGLHKDHLSSFSAEREVNKVLVIVVTSDRGLCGAFNSNSIKGALALINEEYSAQFTSGNLWIMPIGKKCYDFFRKRDYQIIDQFANLFSQLSYENVQQVAQFAMDGFLNMEYDRVEIVYNEFKNVATQILKQEQFLPIASIESDESTKPNFEFIFEPSIEDILRIMIPRMLKVQFYKAILESNASEYGARMTAMDQATDNAGELLKELKLVYNRTRQAAITTEILEIVGGAEALENG